MKYNKLIQKHGFKSMADAKKCKNINRLRALLMDMIEQEMQELSVLILLNTGNQLN